MKLFESIMNYFDNDSLGLLGAVLGEHEVKVRDGVEAAVPEILSAIGARTESQEGRSMLWRELRDTDKDVASSFSSQLHYQKSQALVENGKQQLAGLVGQDIDAITKRVSHAADIGSSSASKMVGAVSPLIFSSLAEWQKKENVDAEGWQKLFADQGEGLRKRAARAATRSFDEKTGQRTFPSFDKTIDTGKGSGDGEWKAVSGFTPGYTSSADEKSQASGLTSKSSDSPKVGTPKAGASKVAAGVAGAAAVAGVAAAGGKAMGAASSTTAQSGAQVTSQVGNKSNDRQDARKNRPAIAADPASSSFASKGATDSAGNAIAAGTATSANAALGAKASTGDKADQPRWVPDTENLKRERERTAIENARSEREARLAKEKTGGLGWLWSQLALLLVVGGLGWMFRGEIKNFVDTSMSGTEVASKELDGNLAGLSAEPGTGETDATEGVATTTDTDATDVDATDGKTSLDGATGTDGVISADGTSEMEHLSTEEAAASEGTAATQETTETQEATELQGTVAPMETTEPPTNSITDPSTPGVGMTDSLENTTIENGTLALSSPQTDAPSAPQTDLASSAVQQSDDAPTLGPVVGGTAVEGSTVEGSAGNVSPPVVANMTTATKVAEDVDLQVETALTSLELGIKNIKDKASAISALPKMEESVAVLEGLLKTSGDWEDVDKELIDIQLEEAAGTFGKLKKSVTGMPNVKSVMTPLFERLEKVLVTQPVAP